MPHLYMGRDSFICVAGLIHMYIMTHSYIRHDSLVRSANNYTHRVDLGDVTHTYV